MLSIADRLPGGKWSAAIEHWRTTSIRYGADEVAQAIPIANLGGPNQWAYIDPTKQLAHGEYAIVEWDAEDDPVEYPDVRAFLRECLATVEYGIDEAKKGVHDERQ
jgi:hypothetical protein